MSKGDALVVSLSDDAPPPRRFENEDGFGVTIHFKRRLNRDQAQRMTKEVGKRRNRRTLVDFDRLYGTTIDKIEGVRIDGGEPQDVTDRQTIVEIMKHIDFDIASEVEDYIMGYSHLGDEAGNS